MKPFDLEKVYDEQIAPLMAQVIEICKKNNLPMCADFLYKNDEEDGEQYCTSYVDVPKEIGTSEHMDELWRVVRPRRSSALRMRVTDGKGNVSETVILG